MPPPLPLSKCDRCSQPIAASDDRIIAEGDVYHQRCWQILRSEAQVASSRKRIKKGESAIQKSKAKLGAAQWSDPVCPICPTCLQPITAFDMVAGRRDRLLHVQCSLPQRRPAE